MNLEESSKLNIVLTVLKDELEYAYKVASAQATQATQAAGYVTPPVTPQSARRAWTAAAQGVTDLLLHQKVDKLLDMATDRREEEQGLVRQIVSRAKEILDLFKCPMCLTKLETGIVMSSCCGQVAGCKRCVERSLMTWTQGAISAERGPIRSSSPNPRGPRLQLLHDLSVPQRNREGQGSEGRRSGEPRSPSAIRGLTRSPSAI